MLDEQKQKVIDNMNLVYYLLHRYYPKFVKNEDVVQSGMFALCRAVDTYDESCGTSFSTYASKCIINAVKREIGQTLKSLNDISIDFSYDTDDGVKTSMLDYLQIDNEDEINVFHINNFIDTLDEREKIVCEYRKLGYTVNDISRLTGYGTHQNISLILKKIERKWRKYNED